MPRVIEKHPQPIQSKSNSHWITSTAHTTHSTLFPIECIKQTHQFFPELVITIMRMIIYSPPLYSTHTMIIAAIIPYSFSFCFSISHFNFCASERNNYASRLPSSSTSAVSAKASVLSTIMSSFSPRSMILSDYHPFAINLLPMLSIITPFTASNFCCTRVAASALGSFHFFCTSRN